MIYDAILRCIDFSVFDVRNTRRVLWAFDSVELLCFCDCYRVNCAMFAFLLTGWDRQFACKSVNFFFLVMCSKREPRIFI